VRLAERVHRKKIKTVYYISPQVWAWGKKRVKRIGKAIEKMLVVFPFEKDIYTEANIPVSFVGHPLIDELKDIPSREDSRRSLELPPGNLVISILPGSRLQEIKLILPVMLKTVLLLKEKFKAHFLLALAPQIKQEEIEKEIEKFVQPQEQSSGLLKIVEDKSNTVISASDLVITASGTATLETAILERPMVIIYKVPFLSYLVLRRLIKLPCIGMANILLKERAVPEFIQYNARSHDIFSACSRILEDNVYRDNMIANLRKAKSLLGGPGAGSRAAEEILGIAYG
jgi:lipid-A-disaccharide synthase